MALPERDQHGYLKHFTDWNEEVAVELAGLEGLDLTGEHWQVIQYVRKFYLTFNTSPAIRPLVKYLKKELGEEKGNSLYLHTLFPAGPARQATKLAGLPKPTRCT